MKIYVCSPSPEPCACLSEAARLGATRLISPEPPRDQAPAEWLANALASALGKQHEFGLLLPAGRMMGEVAGRLAALMDAAIFPDVLAPIKISGTRVRASRPMPGQEWLNELQSDCPRWVATVIGLTPEAVPSLPALNLPPSPQPTLSQVLGSIPSPRTGEGLPPLATARIVISGGGGMGGPNGFHLLRQLCQRTGAALGASRSAVMLGWIGHEHQVGLSGSVISPDLYIACGISGSIQHLAGIAGAKTVVAINRDPNAPIFSVAAMGIVEDVRIVIERLIGEIEY